MNWRKIRLKKRAKVMLGILGAFVILGFASRQYANIGTASLTVQIDSLDNNRFVTEEEIVNLVKEISQTDSSSAGLDDIDLKDLEAKLRQYSFVADCQASRDLRGNLLVEVQQRRPLARVVLPKGAGAYVAEGGYRMALSNRFTARVPLVTGDGAAMVFAADSLTPKHGQPLYQFLRYIQADAFWKAQIAQIDIDTAAFVSLYPQVGDQVIEFGRLDNYEEKLKKLNLFYKEIVPAKGWNAYKIVKLGYDGQIVCE